MDPNLRNENSFHVFYKKYFAIHKANFKDFI